MSNLPTLGLRELTNAGSPLAGGKLYFYAAGTTTPKATYPTEADLEALTSANANPVVADSNGRFGEIFLLTTAAYKVILKTSAGVTIDEWDNINATALTSYDTTTRIKQIASNPVDYGAIGDGVADESAEVQAAIDAATGVVDLLGLTYRCDTALTVPSGITVRNGSLSGASGADNNVVKITGSRGAYTDLTGNAVIGDEVVNVTSAAGLAAGDLIYIHATDAFEGVGSAVGEVCEIRQIAALAVSLTSPLLDNYTVANGAKVQKLTTVDDVVLEDLRIIGGPSTVAVVDAVLARRFVARNVSITSASTVGIGFRFEAFGSTLIACDADGLDIGYVAATHSQDVVMHSCRATRSITSGFSIGEDTGDEEGVARFVTMVNCYADGVANGFAIGVDSEYASVSGIARMLAGGTSLDDSGYRTRNFGVADLASGNYDGAVFVGGGTGDGVQGTGGATGPGGNFIGGSTSGAGVVGTATAGDSDGVQGAGQGTGDGVQGTGGATGVGVNGVGGATSGAGVKGTGTAGNSNGVAGVGQGSAAGVYGTGGATGRGVHGVGGATSGAGVYGAGTAGNSYGVHGAGQGSAAGLYGVGGASSGAGVYGLGGATGVGVNGQGTGNDGVYGYVTGAPSNSFAGVRGVANTSHGVWADQIGSAFAPFRITPTASNPGGPNRVGDFYVDTAGVLYSCTVAGTPGTWTKVSAT